MKTLFLAVLLTLATGCAADANRESSGNARASATSLELISRAAQHGEIDGDTATLYRVFAVVDDARLPERYRGNAPIRDGTSVLRDARSRFEGLRPEVQAELEPYLFPRGRP